MKTHNSAITKQCSKRYPNAVTQVYDKDFAVWDEAHLKKTYGKFLWWMRMMGLTSWLSEKLDCDDWARLFIAYVIIRNALSKNKVSKALGLLCYKIDGGEYHAINTAAVRHGSGTRMVEIEPQPRGGVKEITETERESAWFVSY